MVGDVIRWLLGGRRPAAKPLPVEDAVQSAASSPTASAVPQRVFIPQAPIVSAESWRARIDAAPTQVAEWTQSVSATTTSPAALVAWGHLLLSGKGVQRDPAAAYDCFQRAARQGHVEATNMVGRCHELGWGVEIDPARAAVFYRQAASAGDAWAQFNLANLLFDGQGVTADRVEARIWYLRAGRQRHVKSMNMLGRYSEEGWGHKPRPVAAFHWYRRGAVGGDFRAQFNFARMLFALGRRDDALGWLKAAIDQGIPVFCANVADELQAGSDPALQALGAYARQRARENPAAGVQSSQ